ncbi:methylated-DNA--[protein]-cysteine S-methyltransferase [Bdellovibrio sp. qaytius]|nr:methylated-DNA--[protein]-cysteine S-methyltransferase [Bdellovibrio sp. qaytius]
MNTEVVQFKFESEVGPIYLEASETGLRGCHLEKQKTPQIKSLNEAGAAKKYLAQAQTEITEYLDGKRKKFSVKLEIIGTDFQKNVWQQLQQIPFGKSVSYKELAENINNPKAVRAVGTANGRNNFCIIIPCHRVIAADGTLGGYSGGLPFKKKLLNLEKISFKD